MRITDVTIAPDPTATVMGLSEPKTVLATFEDGSRAALFSFYSDELRFTEGEFVGLTADEARDLHHRRDVDWLRS